MSTEARNPRISPQPGDSLHWISPFDRRFRSRTVLRRFKENGKDTIVYVTAKQKERRCHIFTWQVWAQNATIDKIAS